MPNAATTFPSRLPDVGTTIFTVMSRLAAECGAINLSQGFPDFSPDPALLDLVEKHMRAGANQYAPMAGVPPLREAIADKTAALYGTRYDPEHEVTVTAGGTQAIFTAITCAVRPGDEVIIFEPVYDCYVPAVELAGGTVVRAQLRFPGYRPDWDEVRRLLSPRTRLIVVNTPHNPTGAVWTAADLDQLAALLRGTDTWWSPTRSTSTSSSTAGATRAVPATPSWRRAASWSGRSARPSTSPAGRSARCWRRES